MKFRPIFLFLSIISISGFSSPNEPNVLLVDSSFAPIRINGKEPFKELCFLISEYPIVIPAKGDCFDAVQWADVSQSDIDLLKGMQDFLSGQSTTLALKWKALTQSQPDETQKVMANYSQAVHGSRSYSVLQKASQSKAKILVLRNLSSVSPQAAHVGSDSLGQASVGKGTEKYSKTCDLLKYSDAEFAGFKDGGQLLPYQKRIDEHLNENPSIKLVNLSLGYKYSWIKEDNPSCPEIAWNREYEVLKNSWTNLLAKQPNVLFVVAAGNESQNFDNPSLAKDDLWPALGSPSNILVVGAMTRYGTRYFNSNFGKLVEIMALGEGIPANSPLPNSKTGHPTELRGTSFAAPVVTGQAIAHVLKNPKISAASLKSKLVAQFFETRKTLIFRSLREQCGANKNFDLCLGVLETFLQTSRLLWDDTSELFLVGKTSWNFAPFPMAFDPSVGASGQIKMLPVGETLLPGLILNPKLGPEELLLTLHHEIFHFASMNEAFKDFFVQSKVDSCISPYQLALLKDEAPAFEREYKFYEKSPAWFKKAASKIMVDSQILKLRMSLAQFYENLGQKISVDKTFVPRRYIELGLYPPCAANLIKAEK